MMYMIYLNVFFVFDVFTGLFCYLEKDIMNGAVAGVNDM